MNEKEFNEAMDRVSESFTLALLATAEAIRQADGDKWSMPIKHYLNLGLIWAEQETSIFLPQKRRHVVYNAILDTITKYFKGDFYIRRQM